MYGLGTPKDYEAFLRLAVSHRAAGQPARRAA
jgi:hypothetical protein